MSRSICVAIGVILAFSSNGTAGEVDATADELVRSALRKEGTSALAERRALLKQAIATKPNHRPARWHSGFVSDEGVWRSVEEISKKHSVDSSIKTYRQRRDSMPSTVAGHVELAEWCRREKLPVRERAHLWAAMSLDRGSLSASQFTRLRNLTAQQTSRREREAASEKETRRWLSIANQLVKKWSSQRVEVRRAADQELSAVQSPRALPAFESVFTHADLPIAKRFVEHLPAMRTHRAGLSLAKQAVYSPYATIRELAAQGLRKRQVEEYAPALMESLVAPVEVKSKVTVGTLGVQLASVIMQERKDSRRVLSLTSNVEYVPYIRGTTLTGRAVPRNRLEIAFGRENEAFRKEFQAGLLKRQEERLNEQAAALNGRICSALKAGTGLQLSDDPQEWWQWWADFNQLETDYEKPVEYITRVETTSVPVEFIIPCSCFVKGTPVWTDRGKIAVDKVRVGDLALSRDPETGETAYKPVLRTTVRPPTETHRVSFGKESFVATGGHVFWIAGHGWTRTRDLKTGQWFHAATEPVQITKVEADESAEAYNLVVADFHTYFVGEAKVLSHDPLFAEPLDAHVPGLPTLH